MNRDQMWGSLSAQTETSIIRFMKRFAWSVEKNNYLKAARGIAFEDIVAHIQSGLVLAVLDHPNKKRYPNQQVFIISINDYAWVVPFVESNTEIFLKTAMPSWKMTKLYLRD